MPIIKKNIPIARNKICAVIIPAPILKAFANRPIFVFSCDFLFKGRPIGLLNLLVAHLDLTVNHESWEAADEVGATALSTVHERVLCAFLLEVLFLLGAPRTRV